MYLGAHEGNNPVYKQAVAELAIWIAENGHRLVYGGSNEGLMAVIADTVLEQGGEVTGIEAQMFVDKGVAHKNLTQLTIVPNITERRTRMIELGDVFIAFPGGRGTPAWYLFRFGSCRDRAYYRHAQGIGGSVRSFLFDRFFKKTGTPKRPS